MRLVQSQCSAPEDLVQDAFIQFRRATITSGYSVRKPQITRPGFGIVLTETTAEVGPLKRRHLDAHN